MGSVIMLVSNSDHLTASQRLMKNNMSQWRRWFSANTTIWAPSGTTRFNYTSPVIASYVKRQMAHWCHLINLYIAHDTYWKSTAAISYHKVFYAMWIRFSCKCSCPCRYNEAAVGVTFVTLVLLWFMQVQWSSCWRHVRNTSPAVVHAGTMKQLLASRS